MYSAYKQDKKVTIWPVCHNLQLPGCSVSFSESINPVGVYIDKMYQIIETDKDSEMIKIISFTASEVSCKNLLKFASYCKPGVVLDLLKEKIVTAVNNERRKFSYDNITKTSKLVKDFNVRKWPVGINSPTGWRALNSAISIENNAYINAVIRHMSLNDAAVETHILYEESYSYLELDEIHFVTLEAEIDSAIKNNNIKKTASLLLSEPRSLVLDQYLQWLMSVDIDPRYAKFAINLALIITKQSKKTGVIRPETKEQDYIYNVKDITDIAHLIYNIGLIDEFMVYTCSAICLPQNVLLLKEINLIEKMKDCCKSHIKYEGIFRSSFACAIRNCNNIEYKNVYSKISINDVFVFTIDIASTLSHGLGMAGIDVFTPVPSKFLKLKTPFLIFDEKRRVVKLDELIVRINVTANRNPDGPRFTDIVPWNHLTLTGSRLATAGAIRPMESEYDSFQSYICGYIGSSEHLMDELFAKCKELMIEDFEIDVEVNPDIKEITEKCKLQTDIDLCYSGELEKFDDFASSFVEKLRLHGEAFMIKRPKDRGLYSWTVYSEILRYPMDIFSSSRDSINLINGFMTCYPKIYFNGKNAFCTCGYLSASVSGINYLYNRMSRNDPIRIMMKSAIREQVTMLINFNESQTLIKWLDDKKKPEPVFGHVSKNNSIFGRDVESLDSEMFWPRNQWMTPMSNYVINIWDGDEMVIPPSYIFDMYYSELIILRTR
jgi:hypothetical protein